MRHNENPTVFPLLFGGSAVRFFAFMDHCRTKGTLGHSDISTTLNIYADVTKELKKAEFANLDEFFKGQSNLAVP